MTRSDTQEHKTSYERIYRDAGIHDEPAFYQRIARLLHPSAGCRVLDVACGEGGLLRAVQQRAASSEVCGVEISEQAARKAVAQSPTVRVVVGNAEQLPFASSSFDRLACLGSLENFMDPLQALSEFRRLLKDDGLLCVMMPNKYWLGDIFQVAVGLDEQIPFQHVERMATLRQWRRVLERSGFAVKRIRGYVKISPLMRGGKLRSLRKFLWTHCLALVCPPSLAWSIVFVCGKSLQPLDASRHTVPWTWRAEWMEVNRKASS